MTREDIDDDDWMNSTLRIEKRNDQAAQLCLNIRVFLNFCQVTRLEFVENGIPITSHSIDWTPRDTWEFKARLRTVVEDGWSNKLWLTPNREWRSSRAGSPLGQVPSIVCRLRLELLSEPRNEHVFFNCYNQGPDTFVTAGCYGPFNHSVRRNSPSNRAGILGSRDVLPSQNGQIPAMHEFGHYIGLSHVNAAASPSDTNSHLAYGVGVQREDVMGVGTQIAPWHAYPWCRRLRRHFSGAQPASPSWHSTGPRPTWKTGRGDSEITWTVTTMPPGPRTAPTDNPRTDGALLV